MRDWLKKHFIPHQGNDHRPHLLHGDTARAIVLIVLFLEVAVFFSSVAVMKGGGFLASVLPAVLGDLTNTERTKASLARLEPNPVLDEAARLKAEDMASKSYFAHTSPEGLTPWHWLDQVGYDYEYAGENLAINFTDSKDVTDAWMNSPGHRANIEKSAYTEMGTGIATGTYQGYETVFVAQIYAKPTLRIATTVSVVAPAAPVTPVTEYPIEDETSTSVAKVSETSAAPTVPAEVLGAETSAISASVQPTFWQKVLSSPGVLMAANVISVGRSVSTRTSIKLFPVSTCHGTRKTVMVPDTEVNVSVPMSLPPTRNVAVPEKVRPESFCNAANKEIVSPSFG